MKIIDRFKNPEKYAKELICSCCLRGMSFNEIVLKLADANLIVNALDIASIIQEHKTKKPIRPIDPKKPDLPKIRIVDDRVGM
jgi:hypothetical protein